MWKFLVCTLGAFLLIGNTIQIVSCQQHAVGKPLGPAGLTGSQQIRCEAGDMGPKCGDCNTLLTCFGSTEFNSQSCNSINPKRPYCVENACSAETSELCVSNSFRCTGSGQFPDPHDCSRYYLCDSVGGKAYAYECPSEFAYDSKHGLCKRTACHTIDCTKIPNRYIVFEADPSIMAYCLDTAARKEIVLFRCPDPKNMQYDPDTLKCGYWCSSEGRFADKLDCHSFYECYTREAQLEARHETCPQGYSYDQVMQFCVKQRVCRNEIGDNDDGESGGGPDTMFFY